MNIIKLLILICFFTTCSTRAESIFALRKKEQELNRSLVITQQLASLSTNKEEKTQLQTKIVVLKQAIFDYKIALTQKRKQLLEIAAIIAGSTLAGATIGGVVNFARHKKARQDTKRPMTQASNELATKKVTITAAPEPTAPTPEKPVARKLVPTKTTQPPNTQKQQHTPEQDAPKTPEKGNSHILDVTQLTEAELKKLTETEQTQLLAKAEALLTTDDEKKKYNTRKQGPNKTPIDKIMLIGRFKKATSSQTPGGASLILLPLTRAI
jgi:hypothetical protein